MYLTPVIVCTKDLVPWFKFVMLNKELSNKTFPVPITAIWKL